MSSSLHHLVDQCASVFGLELGERTERLVSYLLLLERWGGRLNLTSTPDPIAIIERHLPDAFALVAEVARREPRRWMDLGSGGGLPGLPFAIALPSWPGTLVEANRRKCTFLRTVVSELGLPVRVEERRAEAPARDGRELEVVELVLSRATWSPDEWLARGAALLAAGGELALFLAREDSLPATPATLIETRRCDYQLSDGTPRLLVLYQRTL